jgi:cytochrome b561
LIAVVLGHVAAALKHQLVDKDALLARMWPGRARSQQRR